MINLMARFAVNNCSVVIGPGNRLKKISASGDIQKKALVDFHIFFRQLPRQITTRKLFTEFFFY